MHLISPATLVVLAVAVATQALIDTSASPAWGWPASCIVIAATLVAVRALGERRRL
jgi:hypothetical protein